MTAAERPALRIPGATDGIDVSAVQGTIDYEKVAQSGFRFAIVKAAEGSNYADPCAAKHLAGFRGVGMYAIPYLFLHPSKGNARLQVSNLVRALGSIWPGRVALDIETRYQAESNAEIIAFLEAAVDVCLEWGALAPALYSYPDYLAHLQPELGASSLGGCPLWMAEYGGRQPWTPPPGYAPHAPLPWHAATLHQYSGDDGYRVPGVFGACDRDLFLGDESALRQWLGLPDIHQADTVPMVVGSPLETEDK